MLEHLYKPQLWKTPARSMGFVTNENQVFYDVMISPKITNLTNTSMQEN